MNLSLTTTTTLALGLALGASASAQTQELFRFDKPAGTSPGWGHSLTATEDLDGDGARDIAVGSFHHGAGKVVSVHSGASGALLFTLDSPNLALFFGDGIACIDDHSGDGVPELVMVGTRSGAHNSSEGVIQIHSGTDGALLDTFIPPAGLNLASNTLSEMVVLDDADGDAKRDVLIRTSSTQGTGLALFSTATGQPIFTVNPGLLNGAIVRASDHDGDGHEDIATVIREQGRNRVEFYSSQTGAFITRTGSKYLIGATGNGEPFLSVEDADGDGLRDFAVGTVFGGFVGRISSVTGRPLGEWDCGTQPIACFGSRLMETADLNGNGRRDLIALSTSTISANPVSLIGLDLGSGEVLFEELAPDLAGGYSGSDRLTALDTLPTGEPTFALFEDTVAQVSVRSLQIARQ